MLSNSLTIRELTVRAKRGDAIAWRELVDCYGRRLLGLLRWRGVEYHDRQDISQETWLRVLQRMQPCTDLWPFLSTVARNLSIDRLRETSHCRLGRLPDDFDVPDPDAGKMELFRRQVRDEAQDLQRDGEPVAAVMIEVDGIIAETASILGLSESAVRKRLMHHRVKSRFTALWNS